MQDEEPRLPRLAAGIDHVLREREFASYIDNYQRAEAERKRWQAELDRRLERYERRVRELEVFI